MKTTLAGLLLLVATNAQAAPDDPTNPNPNDPTNPTPTDPDPTIPDEPKPTPIGEPIPAPTPPPDPIPTVDPTPAPQTNVVVTPAPTVIHTEDTWNRIGFGLTLGGGVEGFTNDTLRSSTDDGGDWTVRAVFGTKLPVALEAAYMGSAQNISALGLDSSAMLVGNGVQGDVRINALSGDAPVQPFIYGGVAWRRYQLTNSDFNTSDVNDEDDVLELPVGLGVAYKVDNFMLDLRGEFRGSFYENLVPTRSTDDLEVSITNDNSAAMHRWGVQANIGVEF
jgi:hypothetical protein